MHTWRLWIKYTAICLCFSYQIHLAWAQTKINRDPKPHQRQDIEVQNGRLENRIPWVVRHELEMGLHYHPIQPTGGLAKVFAPGKGASFFASLDFPYITNARMGTSAGYASMDSKVDSLKASISILPIMVFSEVHYIFTTGFRPYLRLGTGFTRTVYEGKEVSSDRSNAESSMNYSVDLGAGLGYRNQHLPMLEILLYANYFTPFQSATYSFILYSIGLNFVF